MLRYAAFMTAGLHNIVKHDTNANPCLPEVVINQGFAVTAEHLSVETHVLADRVAPA
ncbi:hypothetical protein D3C76_1789560 [compost metagenome]